MVLAETKLSLTQLYKPPPFVLRQGGEVDLGGWKEGGGGGGG